jgi:hypothetical protein
VHASRRRKLWSRFLLNTLALTEIGTVNKNPCHSCCKEPHYPFKGQAVNHLQAVPSSKVNFQGEASPYSDSSRDPGPLLNPQLSTPTNSAIPFRSRSTQTLRCRPGLVFFSLDLRDNIRETAFSDVGKSSIPEDATS